jgi:hypothetical protein
VLDEGSYHATSVDAWLERSAKGLSPAALLQLFETAFNALWARTSTTLGEVTLTAIADRVLYNATEKFPVLSSLRVEPHTGIQFDELRKHIDALSNPEMTVELRYALVEFLTVLNNLTAGILATELYSELSKVAPAGEKAPSTTATPANSEGEAPRS